MHMYIFWIHVLFCICCVMKAWIHKTHWSRLTSDYSSFMCNHQYDVLFTMKLKMILIQSRLPLHGNTTWMHLTSIYGFVVVVFSEHGDFHVLIERSLCANSWLLFSNNIVFIDHSRTYQQDRLNVWQIPIPAFAHVRNTLVFVFRRSRQSGDGLLVSATKARWRHHNARRARRQVSERSRQGPHAHLSPHGKSSACGRVPTPSSKQSVWIR